MLLLDLTIVVLTLAAGVWGFREGITTGAIILVGFAVGAVLGSRVAPLILSGGYEDPYAPVLALPAALLVGAIAAALFERLGFRLRRRIDSLGGLTGSAGGALLAACLCLVAIWILAALVARVDELRGEVRDSKIVGRLNAVLPPPGPLLEPAKPKVDPLPRLTGPTPDIPQVDPAKIQRDPQIQAAAASVVKVLKAGCERPGRGSGWIAADGIVVTNAHVVDRAFDLSIQVRGKGRPYPGRVIWFDRARDVAVMRVPAVSGLRALPLGSDPPGGSHTAALGYPGGGPYTTKPARTAKATRYPGLRVNGTRINARVIPFRAVGTGPGSSGGPIVDRSGRVRGMVFAGRAAGDVGVGVSTANIRRALRREGKRGRPMPCD